KLDLDAAQKQKLNVLAEKLQAQRTAMRDAGGAGGTRSQFQSLFAGARLDQAGASKMIDEKIAALRSGSPEVIAAAADFFDNLNPAQQQKVRDFMNKGGRRWGRHG
ncbi:MAG: Spy/CpxP family protein refolding chaperone, partial [Rhodoferax sp.]